MKTAVVDAGHYPPCQGALNGKVALVTGGSRGIGSAICQCLANEGAMVVFTYRASEDAAKDLASSIKATGGRAAAIRSDCGDEVENVRIVERVMELFGRLDILVHNAGIAIIKPLGTFANSDFDRVFAVNVRSVLLTTQAAAAQMVEGGRVIVIGSTVANRAPFPGLSLYAASKAALVGLVKGMARDLGRDGITVNLVEPGPIDTDMNPTDSAIAPAHIDLMTLDRYGRPDEVASLVAYLARPESSLVNGTRLPVDGGFSV